MSEVVDILLYVALNEEFNSIKSILGDGFRRRELKGVALTGYYGTVASVHGKDFRIAVFPAGKMGIARSAGVTSLLIERLKPLDVVVLGIAGSLASDMKPGDVFIPDSVNEYLANSATYGEGDTWTFRTSSNHYQTSHRLLNRFQNMDGDLFSRWQRDVAERRAATITKPIEAALAAAGLGMRGACKLYVGDDRKLASGPAVGKGKAFVEWITQEVDRKVAGIEMEAAGAYDAGMIRTPAPRLLTIRGISDYADARKDKIEATAKGLFRELSIRNAISLLIAAAEAGIFEREAGSSKKSARSRQVSKRPDDSAAARITLRKELASLYPRVDEARRVMRDCGVDTSLATPFDSADVREDIQVCWAAVLEALEKQDRLQVLGNLLEREAPAVSLLVHQLLGKLENKSTLRVGPTIDGKKHAFESIPAPPAIYTQPPYIGSLPFVGREAEIRLLDDWAVDTDRLPICLLEAIGGMGKSTLAWEWLMHRSTLVRSDWAGRVWYSFYEDGALMSDFCQRALAYMTGTSLEDLRGKNVKVLAPKLIEQLRARPWLFVLDGLERVLSHYNRVDFARVPDEAASNPRDPIGQGDPCAAIRTEDDELLHALAAASPSKFVITSRLLPTAFVSKAKTVVDSVKYTPLTGLLAEEAEALIRACGVTGTSAVIQDFLERHCGNHPLVIGVIAGLVNEHLADQGNFDAWLLSSSGGSRLRLDRLDLRQKQNHILTAALDTLSAHGRKILNVISLVSGAVDYETLTALNPYSPPPPSDLEQAFHLHAPPPSQQMLAPPIFRVDRGFVLPVRQRRQADQDAELEARRLSSARQKLGDAIRELQRRGLLQYDKVSKRYDLHPVVRAVVAGQIAPKQKENLGGRVVDHFSRQTLPSYYHVKKFAEIAPQLHVIYALLQLGQLQRACRAYLGVVCNVLINNFQAYAEVLAIERPFFARGWGELPIGVSLDDALHLAVHAAQALKHFGHRVDARALQSAIIRRCLDERYWHMLASALLELAGNLPRKESAATARYVSLAYEIAKRLAEPEPLFVVGLRYFTMLSEYGCRNEAEHMWEVVTSMGREWPKANYRPGGAELAYAFHRFRLGKLTEHDLAKAEALIRADGSMTALQDLYGLRGAWQLKKREWVAAGASLADAVRMANESGESDPRNEARLALALVRLDEPIDAVAKAEQLLNNEDPPYLDIAELWLSIGDRARAEECALKAYASAWGDGEPNVRRPSLTEAQRFLEDMNANIPELATRDERDRLRFDWEEELVQAISELPHRKT